jgi:uncharacterized protein (TIRG00374 family)
MQPESQLSEDEIPELPDSLIPDDIKEESGHKPVISLKKIVWPVLLGLSVLAVIGYVTFDADVYRSMWNSLNPLIMSGAVVCVIVRILFGGKRLSYVSHDRLSFKGGVRGQLAWDFAANITPSLVGGAPIAAYFIAQSSEATGTTGSTSQAGAAKSKVRMGEVTAFMMFIMLLDQAWFALSVPVILISALFMEVIPASAGAAGSATAVVYFVGFMIWTGLFAYATLFRPHLLAALADRVCRLPGLRKFRQKVSHEMDEYQERAAILRRQPLSFFAKGLFLTGGTWVARYALVVFIVWSFVPDVDQLLLFIRSIAMTIGSLVMPTPGGAGGVEGLYVLFFSSLMPGALLAPTLLIWRILGYYIFLGFGLFITTHHVKKRMDRKNSTVPE